MTFDEFAEAMRKEGFYRNSIDSPATRTAPTVFVRPLTGQVYFPRTGSALKCRVSANGDRAASATWTNAEEALRMAKAREV